MSYYVLPGNNYNDERLTFVDWKTMNGIFMHQEHLLEKRSRGPKKQTNKQANPPNGSEEGHKGKGGQCNEVISELMTNWHANQSQPLREFVGLWSLKRKDLQILWKGHNQDDLSAESLKDENWSSNYRMRLFEGFGQNNWTRMVSFNSISSKIYDQTNFINKF